MGDGLTFDRRKAVITIGISAAVAIGAFALLGQIAHYGELQKAVGQADKVWFPVCILGELLAYVGYVVGYRDIARAKDGPDLGYWTVTRVVVLGFGAYVVGSAAGTLALDYWALERAGEDRHQAARRVLALNTLEWGVLGTFAAFAAVATLAGAGAGAPLPMTLAWLTAVPACLLAAAWVSSPARVGRLRRLPENEEPEHKGRDAGLWLRWLWVKVRKGFADAVGAVAFLRSFVRRPRRHLGGLGGFPLYWIGDMLTLYAALRAFGVTIGPAALILGYTTAYVVTALPLPAGGSGGVEATLAATLHLVGVPFAPALLGAFTYRIFVFWLPIVPALAFVPTVKQLDDELPRAERSGVGREEAPEAA